MCVYVCMSVNVYVSVYVCMCMNMCICTCVSVYMCIVCRCVCMCVHVSEGERKNVCVCVCNSEINIKGLSLHIFEVFFVFTDFLKIYFIQCIFIPFFPLPQFFPDPSYFLVHPTSCSFSLKKSSKNSKTKKKQTKAMESVGVD